MVLDFFRSGGSQLDEVEKRLVAMLRDGRVVFDAAAEAVFGGGKSRETKQTVKGTDREINESQREVRRALLMSASVGGAADLPQILAYMSVVKDVERVGDYAKNIYDLAKYGVDFTDASDRTELEAYRNAVGSLLDEAAEVFEERDVDRAQQLVTKADAFLSEYNAKVKETTLFEGPAIDAVARALYFRYLKRITAHVMNLMTSLFVPLDQLDSYDEAVDDRI